MLTRTKPSSNPLHSPRSEEDFLACWPGATCEEVNYSPGLTVYVLRLADGMLVAISGSSVTIWDKGMALMEKGFSRKPQRVPLAARKLNIGTLGAIPA
jgi:hypothetical protein